MNTHVLRQANFSTNSVCENLLKLQNESQAEEGWEKWLSDNHALGVLRQILEGTLATWG